jgi:hypothetical protein
MNMHAGADDLLKLVLNMHDLVEQARLVHIVEQNYGPDNFSSLFPHPFELADKAAKGVVNSL